MRIKELQKMSMLHGHQLNRQIYLAAGTAAQQLTSTFSSESAIKIYDINLSNPGYEMVLRSSQETPRPFHKILWSPAGID